jgi:hypothetical protein
MGWLDYHLHAFKIINPDNGEAMEIGIPDDEVSEEEKECLPGWEIPIIGYFHKIGQKADYEYDFGDGWEHEVFFEGVLFREPKMKYPRCIGGARACPPEDCGGPHGYQEMLKIIRTPSHREHKSMMEWVGGKYDPEAFDPKNVRFDNPKKRWKIAFASSDE